MERGSSSGAVSLREVVAADLPIFFAQQLDPAANYMAAFTAKDPADREAFAAHWARILADETTINRTVELEGHVAGHIAKHEGFGVPEISYWIGRDYWGRGIATRALVDFLGLITVRPLYARAAADNAASIRVLEKCGFKLSGRDRAFANARGAEIEEFIYMLPAADSPDPRPYPAE
jgi:RimJ/RimL family protein N-acetyltransferase